MAALSSGYWASNLYPFKTKRSVSIAEDEEWPRPSATGAAWYLRIHQSRERPARETQLQKVSSGPREPRCAHDVRQLPARNAEGRLGVPRRPSLSLNRLCAWPPLEIHLRIGELTGASGDGRIRKMAKTLLDASLDEVD